MDKPPKEEGSKSLDEENFQEKNFLGDLFLDTISSFSDSLGFDFI